MGVLFSHFCLLGAWGSHKFNSVVLHLCLRRMLFVPEQLREDNKHAGQGKEGLKN